MTENFNSRHSITAKSNNINKVKKMQQVLAI